MSVNTSLNSTRLNWTDSLTHSLAVTIRQGALRFHCKMWKFPCNEIDKCAVAHSRAHIIFVFLRHAKVKCVNGTRVHNFIVCNLVFFVCLSYHYNVIRRHSARLLSAPFGNSCVEKRCISTPHFHNFLLSVSLHLNIVSEISSRQMR